MSKYYIESNGIWKGKHQLSWAELCDELKQLEEENEQLKREVKRLKCINKQLEERLDKDIALNMDCGDVE